MLSVLRFILNTVVDFCSMLFSIQVDDGLSLGLLMCIVFIFLPMMLRVIRFLKQDALEELDDLYDESKPRETWQSNEHQRIKTGNGQYFSTSHIRTRSRRYRLR